MEENCLQNNNSKPYYFRQAMLLTGDFRFRSVFSQSTSSSIDNALKTVKDEKIATENTARGGHHLVRCRFLGLRVTHL